MVVLVTDVQSPLISAIFPHPKFPAPLTESSLQSYVFVVFLRGVDSVGGRGEEYTLTALEYTLGRQLFLFCLETQQEYTLANAQQEYTLALKEFLKFCNFWNFFEFSQEYTLAVAPQEYTFAPVWKDTLSHTISASIHINFHFFKVGGYFNCWFDIE